MPGLTFGGLDVIAYATLTISDTAVGLADGNPALVSGKVNNQLVTRAFFTLETDDVRWRADGTAPTASEGHKLFNGDSIIFVDVRYSKLLENIRFIRITTDAALKITYFRLQGDYIPKD